MSQSSKERQLIQRLLSQGGEAAIQVLVDEAKNNPIADQVLRDNFIKEIDNQITLGDLLKKVQADPAREALLERSLTWFMDLQPQRGQDEMLKVDRARKRSTAESIERVKKMITEYLDENIRVQFKKSQLIEDLSLERARVETALKQLKSEGVIGTSGERAATVYFSRKISQAQNAAVLQS